MTDDLQGLQVGVNIIPKVNTLQERNSRITIEYNYWREQAEADSAARKLAEDKRERLQGKLDAAQTRIKMIQQQSVKLSSSVKRLKKTISRYDLGLKKIVSVSQKLDSEKAISSDEEESGTGGIGA